MKMMHQLQQKVQEEQDGDRDERESNEDETSETLVQEEASHAHRYDLVTHTE